MTIPTDPNIRIRQEFTIEQIRQRQKEPLSNSAKEQVEEIMDNIRRAADAVWKNR